MIKAEKMIFATDNKDKLREIREIMEGFDIPVVSKKQAGIETDVEENGSTFEENALIKARAIWNICGGLVLSDDSGLEIDALNKEPGVLSARYLGKDTSYHEKNNNLIERLSGVPDEKRTARFVCAVAAVFPDGSEKVARGVMEGRIGYEEKGENGFGYDPVFVLPAYGKTTAELSPAEKNRESHRGKALRLMRKEIEDFFNENTDSE